MSETKTWRYEAGSNIITRRKESGMLETMTPQLANALQAAADREGKLVEALRKVSGSSCTPHRYPGYEVCAHGYRPSTCPIAGARALISAAEGGRG